MREVEPFGLYMWSPEFIRYRQSPQFKQLMRETGTVDNWRERGWPKACLPVGENDLECE